MGKKQNKKLKNRMFMVVLHRAHTQKNEMYTW